MKFIQSQKKLFLYSHVSPTESPNQKRKPNIGQGQKSHNPVHILPQHSPNHYFSKPSCYPNASLGSAQYLDNIRLSDSSNEKLAIPGESFWPVKVEDPQILSSSSHPIRYQLSLVFSSCNDDSEACSYNTMAEVSFFPQALILMGANSHRSSQAAMMTRKLATTTH